MEADEAWTGMADRLCAGGSGGAGSCVGSGSTGSSKASDSCSAGNGTGGGAAAAREPAGGLGKCGQGKTGSLTAPDGGDGQGLPTASGML